MRTRAQEEEIIGTVLDRRYRIERLLGEGGMGLVYLGEHMRTGRKCAVKLLPPEASDDVAAVQRFEREARVLGGLGHPGIVGVHDFSETANGRPFFVMDYLKGEDLSERLARVGTLDWESAKKVVDEISAALWAAHQAGVLHRDLKPGNVFLAQSPAAPERVVLLDFGLAKGGVANAMTLTQSNMVMGTPLYMSPEQARSVGVDARSDLYSLAAMTYELLAGRPPFVGPNFTAVLARLLTETPRKLSERVPLEGAVPEYLDEVLDIALSKDPEDRQPDVASFATAVLQRRPAWADTTARSIESALTPRVRLGTGVGVATGPPLAQDSDRLQMAATVASSPPASVAVDEDPRMAATVASDPELQRQVTVLASSEPGPIQAKSPKRRKRPLLLLLVVGLVVLGSVGAALAYWAGRRGSGSAPHGRAAASSSSDLASSDGGAPVELTSDAKAALGGPDSGVDSGVDSALETPVGFPHKGAKAGEAVVRKVIRNATNSRRPRGVPPGRVADPMRRATSVSPPSGFPHAMKPSRAVKDRLVLAAFMTRRDYKGCIRAAARMPPRQAVLQMKLSCIMVMGNWSLARKECRKFLKRYPSVAYGRTCRSLLKNHKLKLIRDKKILEEKKLRKQKAQERVQLRKQQKEQRRRKQEQRRQERKQKREQWRREQEQRRREREQRRRERK